jgi:beta-glucuronidase
MKHLPKKILTSILLLLGLTSFAQYHIRQPNAIPLHGEWLFALDPAEAGVTNKWYTNKTAESGRMDKVVVPHCSSSDPRYAGYTGTVWYLKQFAWKPVWKTGYPAFRCRLLQNTHLAERPESRRT